MENRVKIAIRKKLLKKGLFHGRKKKYLQFQTSNIPDRLRIRYRITMVKILIIQGTFYEQELQKTTQDVYIYGWLMHVDLIPYCSYCYCSYRLWLSFASA